MALGSFRYTWSLIKTIVAKHEGPYRIVERASFVNYVIEPVEPSAGMRRRGRDIVNVERLKTYYDPLIVTSC